MNDERKQQPPHDRPDHGSAGAPGDWYEPPSRGGGGFDWGPKERRPRRWPARIVVIAAFLACVVLVFVVVDRAPDWIRSRSNTTTTQTSEASTVRVIISAGMSATQVGRVLEEEGVIESASAFVDLVKARGSEGRLLPGTYQFALGLELLEVVDKLEKGEGSASFRLTIPEGMAVGQVGALLTEDEVMDGESYVELSTDPDKFVVPKLGGESVKVTTLEGLLFPSTYYLLDGDGPTELIGAQLSAFEAKTASLPWENAETLGLSPYEIVIVASLIEKEASVAEERPLVAAVIYNRLKEEMTLGIDATVRYAVDKWTGALTDEDLQVDSPYNTRVVKGLPPTPISNPGVAALKAALEPAEVDYLYYVLQDEDGHHFFTASYDEFLEAKKNAPQ